MAYTYRIHELKTGRFLDTAPFAVEGSLPNRLQDYGLGRLNLAIRARGCPSDWEEMILPWRVLIVAVDDDNNIVGHGIPTKRQRRGSGVVSYACTTLPGYLLRRHVPTRTYVRQDQTLIARELAAICAGAAGIPLRFDCPASGVLVDKEYAADENASVLGRLQELAAADNGFNWTVEVGWADPGSPRHVVYTFRTGHPYLGTRTPNPTHVFELIDDAENGGGNITDYSFEESWEDNDSATDVQASGSGNGGAKMLSERMIDTVRESSGIPRLESRPQLSSESNQQALDNFARGQAELLFGGREVITLTVRDGHGTSLRDLTLGDTAKVLIRSEELNLDRVMVVVGTALTPSDEEFAPTLAFLGGAA